MPIESTSTRGTKPRTAPEVVSPSSRVNVALPFSTIHIEESSKDLAELAAVVAELASSVEGLSNDPRVKTLVAQAQAVAARLR